MLRIGEFAALARVSMRMLRHYDELGLLKPARVDPESEYRYYTLEQLPRLNRILALKDLGLALEEIRLLLDDVLTAEDIRGMLKLKQAQLEHQIRTEQERLQRVANRLRYIEQEGRLPDTEVVLKPQDALPVVTLRGFLGMERPVPHLFVRVQQILRQHQAGPLLQYALVIYHGSLTVRRGEPRIPAAWMVDAGFTLLPDAPLPDWPPLQTAVLPAYPQVASMISTKPDLERHLDVQQLWQWIFSHNYRLCAPVREVYLHRPTSTDPRLLTEIIFPIVYEEE